MAGRIYATIGRSDDCDVAIDHPTVSTHHARLSWSGGVLVVEDLASANGTFLDGQRIKSARCRPGADIRCGAASLPWSHDGLRPLLRSGAPGNRTLAMPKVGTGSYLCGSCSHLGLLPTGKMPAKLTCEKCGAALRVRVAEPSGAGGALVFLLTLVLVLGVGLGAWWVWIRPALAPAAPSPVTPEPAEPTLAPAGEPAPEPTPVRLAKALTPMDPVTRNAAARLAARSQGPFHVEQVAEIWSAVRRDWRYVNDPRGRDYFASARETIENGYIGDCDDFAIVLVSMVTAIGGEGRVVLMEGPGGGHAYAEACVHGEPDAVARALGRLYRVKWRAYLQGAAPRTISYRRTDACPIWLNLDWNAAVPGGPYEAETRATAVYEGGRAEELAPSPGPPTAAR